MVLFENRVDAGERLAVKLQAYQGTEAIVLAIPRGGVVVAAPIARRLGLPLDVIIPRKIGTPGDPELAVGAVTPDGHVLWNRPLMQRLGLTPEDLRPQVDATIGEIQRRFSYYRGDLPEPVLGDRMVILVDDGIATGFTTKAALRCIARQRPSKTVLAVPVAPAETVADLAAEVDEVVCLATPEPFFGVGQFYRDFAQTSDKEVKALLAALGHEKRPVC